MLGASSGRCHGLATVPGAQGSPVIFSATALGWVTPVVDPSTDNQLGDVTASLARPLRITAFAGGAPAEGVTVTWSTGDGTITPLSSATDRFGAAAATWTLPEAAGEVVAQVSVDRTTGLPLTFHATARAGRAVAVGEGPGRQSGLSLELPELRLPAGPGSGSVRQCSGTVDPGLVGRKWPRGGGRGPGRRCCACGTDGRGRRCRGARGGGGQSTHARGFPPGGRSPVPLVLLDLGARTSSVEQTVPRRQWTRSRSRGR